MVASVGWLVGLVGGLVWDTSWLVGWVGVLGVSLSLTPSEKVLAFLTAILHTSYKVVCCPVLYGQNLTSAQ